MFSFQNFVWAVFSQSRSRIMDYSSVDSQDRRKRWMKWDVFVDDVSG